MPVATLGLGCLLYFIHTGKRLSDRVNQLTLKADFAARRQKSTGKAAEWDRAPRIVPFLPCGRLLAPNGWRIVLRVAPNAGRSMMRFG